MAMYKTHTRFNIFLALPIFVGLMYFFNADNKFIITFCLAFIYATFFMNPDMDLADRIKLFSIKGFFTFPFRIYSKVFRHRGLSHNFFLGTLTRVLFMGIFFLAIFYFINKRFISTNDMLSFYKMYKNYILFGFAAFFLADICHLVLDIK